MKKTMVIYLSIVSIFLTTTAVMAATASHPVMTHPTTLANFSAIKVSGNFDVLIQPSPAGTKPRVAVTAPPDLQKEMNVAVDHQTLKISDKQKQAFSSSDQAVKVVIYTSSDYNRIQLDGHVTAKAQGFSGDSLAVYLNGNVNLTLLADRKAKVLTKLNVGLNGKVQLVAKQLQAQAVTVRAHGNTTSSYNIARNGSLTVHAMGKNTIHYRGEAVKVTKTMHGNNQLIHQ